MVETLSALTTSSHEVKPDIFLLNFTIVNACFIGDPNGDWVLVDTGLENSADYIVECARERFGENHPPKAIILTHGHFDHVGSVIKLAQLWDVPVYIHELELPYVTGKKDYPVGDATVFEGMVAMISPTFPHTSIDIRSHIRKLPDDGSIPGLTEWRWILVPGHTEGQIALYRERDGVVIVADTLCTTKQESLLSVVTHREEISGPPKYLTTDWEAAKSSIKRIRDLHPKLLIASHGESMEGSQVMEHLDYLIRHFDEIALPKQGRFVKD